MEIYLGDHLLQSNTKYPAEDIRELSYLWDHGNELHTFVIYDIDAPSAPYIHQLVVNIPGHDIRSGDIIFDYADPNPPRDDPNHRYLITLYQQPFRVEDVRDTTRSRYDLDHLIGDNGMQFIDKAVLEVNPRSYKFFMRDKATDPLDPLHPLIMPNASLSEKEIRYCSCVPKVAAEQTDRCLEEQAWGEQIDGKTCYSPYAVCGASTHGTNKKCGVNYNFEEFPAETKRKYYKLSGKK